MSLPTNLPTLDPQRRQIICHEIAGEIVEHRRLIHLADAHGWTATAAGLRRQVQNLRRAWHWYHHRHRTA